MITTVNVLDRKIISLKKENKQSKDYSSLVNLNERNTAILNVEQNIPTTEP